ncbi:TonB-dependent receptor [Mucilaginibacter aquaedulcis]|uniref:TonB-dependent receptor n=1 Tax=Mucilaginibacter aquaedulcis TaxID=1187081 RepID=UPI0025B2D692|nr:TonB-dependent receptor [Mucilaginibacter aquaedulcis]MDN3549211.1 TonB-dependent receptor [Mucilaginibacter aquaedulcis]
MKFNFMVLPVKRHHLFRYFLAMKLTTVLIFAVLLDVSAKGFSQTVTIHENNVSVEKVLKIIKKQSGYNYLFEETATAKTSKINIDITNASVEDALDKCFIGQPLTYKIIQKTAVIKARTETPVATADNITIKGKVTDKATGEPLIGASVRIKGRTNGVSTNVSGDYVLTTPDDAVLVVSYIGYVTIEVPVNKNPKLNISLEVSGDKLNEVVVIGYGSQKKKDITSAISVVELSDVKERPLLSVAESIAGKVPGTQVLQPSGKPGADLTVFVRGVASLSGNTQPLYVIDGVVAYDTRSIDPNSIESISILKDAAAAGIYGAAGSTNGVVLITTKKGSKGKTRVDLNLYSGDQRITKKLSVLNSQQLADLLTEEEVNSGNTVFTIPASTIAASDNNWQDLIYRKAASTGVNANFSGGGDKGTYSFGVGYVDQDGIILTSNYKRYSSNLTVEQEMNKWLSAGAHINYNRTNYADVYDNQRANYGGVVLSALTTPPFSSIYNPNGDGTYGFNTFSQGVLNPLGGIYGQNNQTVGNNILGEGHIQIKLPLYLTYRSQFGVTLENAYNTVFQDPRLTSGAKTLGGISSYNTSENFRYIWDNTLTFDHKFGSHSVNATIGTSASKQHGQSSAQSGYGFPSPGIHELSAASNYTINQTFQDEWTLQSYFARVNYAYNDKYLLTATVRRDGSSKLGIKNQWGNFPAFSAGWRVSSEDFMKGLTAINDLKLRAGWGATGNLPADLYPSYSLLSTGNNYAYDGTTIVSGTAPSSQAGNPNLRWEETKQFNAGVDISFFNSLINITADYYIKRTRGLILPVQQPLSSGVSTVEENLPGYIQNKGFEFVISANVIRKKDISWTSSYNMSFNRNVAQFPQGTAPIYTGYIQDIGGNAGIVQSGLPLGSFYGYIDDGVNPQTGNINFRDLNHDNKISPDQDRTYLGSALPKFSFGFNNQFSIYDFDLNFLVDGVYGNKIYNATRMETEAMTELVNQTTNVLRRWRKPGDITDVPKAQYGNAAPANSVPNYSISSRWVENGSYLKVRQITLAYNFRGKWLEHAGITKLRPYVTLQNMFTITGYKGYSPELNATSNYGAGANVATQMGFDHGTYPQAKGFTFGINATL